MKRQLPLPLPGARDLRTEPFRVSPCNALAVGLVEGPWPGGALALIGPEASGKSHLAARWANRSQGVVLARPPASLEPLPSALAVEEAQDWPDPELLFHLLNQAQAGERRLLLIARTRPAAWPAALPDLRSRLNALPVAELDEPDDALLAQVLRDLFRERFIVPADDLIPWLLRRMERSFAAARQAVEALHEAGAAQGRAVNRSLAIETFTASGELFGD